MANGIGKLIRESASRLPAALLRPFGRPAALFFHGVEKRIDDSCVQSNHHDSAAFFEIARSLAAQFDVLPLAELEQVLRAPARHRRTVFLMSDDGYANTLSEAAPILGEFKLPWTVFVSTRHIDTAERSPAFLARLFCLFANDGKHDLPNLGAIELRDRQSRERAADAAVGALKALAAPRADDSVRAMCAALGEDALAALLARFRSDAFLSWPEVRALKAQGVEIGAHAHRHWAMNGAQSGAYLREQAQTARARIEAEVGPCRYFAYPFGNTEDVSREAWRAVRDAGYDYAFTTLSGSLDAGANRWLMPRYGLQPRETRLASLVPILRMGNGRLGAWQRGLS